MAIDGWVMDSVSGCLRLSLGCETPKRAQRTPGRGAEFDFARFPPHARGAVAADRRLPLTGAGLFVQLLIPGRDVWGRPIHRSSSGLTHQRLSHLLAFPGHEHSTSVEVECLASGDGFGSVTTRRRWFHARGAAGGRPSLHRLRLQPLRSRRRAALPGVRPAQHPRGLPPIGLGTGRFGQVVLLQLLQPLPQTPPRLVVGPRPAGRCIAVCSILCLLRRLCDAGHSDLRCGGGLNPRAGHRESGLRASQ